MVIKSPKKGAMRFVFKPHSKVQKVQLAGDFTDWKPISLRKTKNGEYSTTVSLSSGRYEYKFQVDNQWMLDPDNQECVNNSFGTLNSVVTIG